MKRRLTVLEWRSLAADLADARADVEREFADAGEPFPLPVAEAFDEVMRVAILTVAREEVLAKSRSLRLVPSETT